MRVRVDKARCTGHALCNFHGPDVYTLDEVGFCSITTLDVPAGLEEQARRGAEGCPERAISIEMDEG
jgi:ferredoxin